MVGFAHQGKEGSIPREKRQPIDEEVGSIAEQGDYLGMKRKDLPSISGGRPRVRRKDCHRLRPEGGGARPVFCEKRKGLQGSNHHQPKGQKITSPV